MSESPVMASDVQPEAQPREGWKSRIVGHGEEDAEQLLANPRNWRIHPKYQQEALVQALDRIGWVQNVIVNTTTGHVVDGHLRVSQAMRRHETVPVTYVELTEEEEALALATLDPLAALAVTDEGALKGLLGDLEGQLDGDLAKMLSDLTRTTGQAAPPQPTQDDVDKAKVKLEERFSKEQRSRMLDVTCPHCAESFGINLAEFDT